MQCSNAAPAGARGCGETATNLHGRVAIKRSPVSARHPVHLRTDCQVELDASRLAVTSVGDGSEAALPSRHDWVHALVLRCQVLAGHFAETGVSLVSDLHAVADLLPLNTTAPERLLLRSLLSTVFGRIVATIDVERRMDATKSLLEWTVSSPTSDEWRENALRFIDRLTAALTGTSRLGPADGRVGVRRALNFIEAHYADANLALKDVAADADLSPWHTTRILKQHTGGAFIAHLRQHRISEARRLLERTSLPVKEIAFAVGYAHSSQFGRDFNRLCGQSPLSFRRTQQEITIDSKN